MADVAIRQLNEVKRLGMKSQEIYKSSHTFMRDLIINAENKKLVNFEIEGKNNKISVEYVPKFRLKNFTKLYQEEFAKENKELKSNRHTNAAEHAREKESKAHDQNRRREGHRM